MQEANELLLLKTAALLHDPPHKPWIVKGRYRVEEGAEGRRAHEREAEALAKKILAGTLLEDALKKMFSSIVHQADVLSSSIDRILHMSEEGSELWGELHVANMFDPKQKFNSTRTPEKTRVEEFAKQMREVLTEVSRKSDYVMAYHALYALLEPLWWSVVGCIGPADTRVPNHTVFDHLYATASAVNIVAGDGINGYIVMLDIAGIQQFVCKARKTIDYWAGSWLVSALAWHLVREVIEKLGPDCLLMPTARLNPFYYIWLTSKARRKGCGKLVEKIKSTLEDIIKGEWPRNPVIPGTLVLVLPSNAMKIMGYEDLAGESGVREYFKSRLTRCWGEIVNIVAEVVGLEGVSKALSLVKEKPPFTLRVKVLSLKNVFEELKSALNNERVAKALLYHHAVTRVFEKRTEYTIYVEQGSFVDWTPITSSAEDYRLCSVCRRLPAVIRYVGGNKYNIYYEGSNEYADSGEIKSLLGLKEGESLCLYCLVKRSLQSPNALKRIVKLLVGGDVEVKDRVFFPSTADVAAVWAKVFILDKIRCASSSVVEKLRDFVAKEVQPRLSIGASVRGSTGIKVLDEKLSEIIKIDGEEGPRTFSAFALAFSDAEELLLSIEARSIVSELKKILGIKNDIPVRRYYAILYADGDDIGELLSGCKWFIDGDDRCKALAEYYMELLGESAVRDDSVKKIVVECARRLNEALSAYESKFGFRGGGRIFIPLTLSYHSCISRALMATAIEDACIIRECNGIVIYAGGDDLTALLPVVLRDNEGELKLPCIEAIIETRRSFWGERKQVYKGFILLGGLSPSLRAVGRSYSIMLAHYRDPLGANINNARRGLREAKRSDRTVVVESICVKKDMTCIEYGRGLPDKVLIPNRIPGDTLCSLLQFLLFIHKLMSKEVVSTSLPRDVVENLGVINEIAAENPSDALKMIKYLVKRNIRVERRAEDVISGLSSSLTKAFIVEEADNRVWIPLLLFKALLLLRGGER